LLIKILWIIILKMKLTNINRLECQEKLLNTEWIFETDQRDTRSKDDIENIKKDLDEVGYSIINVINSDDANNIYTELIDDIIDYKMIPKDMIDDVRELLVCYLLNTHNGIVSYGENMTHCRALWQIRSNPNIVELMSKLYECKNDELAVSFDTFGMRYAPELFKLMNIKYDELNEPLEPHIDQRFELEEFEHYQGIYVITDSDTNDDAGLVIYPSTHKLHGKKLQELLKTRENADFIKYPKEFFKIFPKCLGIKLNVKAGDMVLWDSRTLHASISINELRNREITTYSMYDIFKLNRIVSYICYTKRDLIKEIDMKISHIYNRGYSTNHMIRRPVIVPYDTYIADEYVNEHHKSLVK
jgi:hypothetical protein